MAAWVWTSTIRWTAITPRSRTWPGWWAVLRIASIWWERNVHRTDTRATATESRNGAVLFEPHLGRRVQRDGSRPARHGLPGGDQADGLRRQARRRLAQGVRWPRLRTDRAADLRQRSPSCRCSAARGHAADRRADSAEVRQRGTEEE